jgi:hypothetical protein
MQSEYPGDGPAGTGVRHDHVRVGVGSGDTDDDKLDGDENMQGDSRDANVLDTGDGNVGTGDRHDDMLVGDGCGGTDDYGLAGDRNVQRDPRDDNDSDENIVDIAGNTSHQYAHFPEKDELLKDDDHLLLFIWMWSFLHRKILQIQLQQTSNLLLVLRKRKRDGNRSLNREYGLEWMDALLPSEFKRGIFTIVTYNYIVHY